MRQKLPAGVFALGFVSLFMDVSSEMIHALLPVFLVGTLGASVLTVGVIEGLAEGLVSVTKLFSGVISDWLGRRKPLLLAGYGLAALTKPLFPLSHSAWMVLGARLLDRFGKGIRGAPRDALVADLTAPAQRGAAYGLRQAMDTVGAILGPLLAIALMSLYAGDIRSVFAWAVLPALCSVLVIVFAVREPAQVHRAPLRRFPLDRQAWTRLGRPFWIVVGLGAALTLARFSEGFLILRGQQAGLATQWLPAVLIVMNLAYSASAYPLGALADRWPRRRLLAVSAVLLLLAQLLLARNGLGATAAGVVLWGLHLGASQGLLAALVADASPGPLRGSAFGLFNLLTGVATILASVIAGVLWQAFGAPAAFLAGAACATLAAAGCLLLPAQAEVRGGA
jgi:MFS family permease